LEKLNGRDQLRYIICVGGILLKWIIKECGMRLRIGSDGGIVYKWTVDTIAPSDPILSLTPHFSTVHLNTIPPSEQCGMRLRIGSGGTNVFKWTMWCEAQDRVKWWDCI
jgi:hypothetical protein